MGATGSQNPTFSGGRENFATAPATITKRILESNYQVRQLLNQISSKPIKIPRDVIEYLKGVEDLTQDLITNPLGQDWKQQFEKLHQETSQIRQDIYAVRMSTTVAAHSQATSSRIRSYADAAKCQGLHIEKT
jgi:hypothetical protein